MFDGLAGDWRINYKKGILAKLNFFPIESKLLMRCFPSEPKSLPFIPPCTYTLYYIICQRSIYCTSRVQNLSSSSGMNTVGLGFSEIHFPGRFINLE